ncbi:hypothetical protein HMI55_003962, partial [Coelomomyces lativittatus]
MAYNPWGNAVVERGHRELKRSIMKLMVQKKQGWVDCLPTALFTDQVASWLHHIELLQAARKQGALQLEVKRESRRIDHNFKVSEKDCAIQVGDLVLVRQNILDTAFTRKLEPRWKGPFKCIKKV